MASALHLTLYATDRQAALVGEEAFTALAAARRWDENVSCPSRTSAALDDESGRGLMLVRLWPSDGAGTCLPTGRGKIVWALLADLTCPIT